MKRRLLNVLLNNFVQKATRLTKKFMVLRWLEKKYVETMRRFYTLSKAITHREIREIKGEEYERNYREAEEFVKRMRMLVDKGRL